MNHQAVRAEVPDPARLENHRRSTVLIDEFEPISLARCNEAASMQDRVDTKFLVNGVQIRNFLGAIRARYRILEIENRREFRYSSCYYDDAFRCYFEHHQGRRQRLKVRTREYVDGGGSKYFEVKLKGLRGRTVKHRCETDRLIVDRVDDEQLQMVRDLYQSHYGKMLHFTLSPALLVSYKRCTLVAADGGERITVDSELRFAKPGSVDRPVPVHDDFIIIETKSSNGKGIANGALRDLRIRPTSKCSKYCVGINLTRSVAKGNTFLPAIRRAQGNVGLRAN